MFGLGTWEIILILIVAVIFVGPDKLPKVASTIGQGMRKVRDAMSQVDDEVRRATRDAESAARSAGEEAKPPRGDATSRPTLPPEGDARGPSPETANAAPTDDLGAEGPRDRKSGAPVDAEGPPDRASDAQRHDLEADQRGAPPPDDAASAPDDRPTPPADPWSALARRPIEGRVAASSDDPSAVRPDDEGPDDSVKGPGTS